MGMSKVRTYIQKDESGSLLRSGSGYYRGIYKPYLRQINSTLKATLPDAVQKISWSMPTYWKKRNLIQFAAFKKHIGLYPGPEAVEAFAGRLKEYKTSKGAIQLPYDKPLPLELISEIARWCEKGNG